MKILCEHDRKRKLSKHTKNLLIPSLPLPYPRHPFSRPSLPPLYSLPLTPVLKHPQVSLGSKKFTLIPNPFYMFFLLLSFIFRMQFSRSVARLGRLRQLACEGHRDVTQTRVQPRYFDQVLKHELFTQTLG